MAAARRSAVPHKDADRTCPAPSAPGKQQAQPTEVVAAGSAAPPPRLDCPRLLSSGGPSRAEPTPGGGHLCRLEECARDAHARIAQGRCWRSRHWRPREPGARDDRRLLPRPDRWPVGPRGDQGGRAAPPVAISAVPTDGIASSSAMATSRSSRLSTPRDRFGTQCLRARGRRDDRIPLRRLGAALSRRREWRSTASGGAPPPR